MKRVISIAAIFICLSAAAQKQVYSVTACPGENASTEMRISWAADTDLDDLYVKVTEVKDKKWKKARVVKAQQKELCTTFDSVYSKTPAGDNFYEKVRFTKCGVTVSALKPDTEYKYSVCGGPEHRFKTAGADAWSACVISDFHSYPPLPKRVVAAMAMVDKVREADPGMDWVLHLGDICAWGGSYSFWRSLYEQDNFKNYMWAGVNGNHDNMTRDYTLTNKFFRDTNYYPRNGYQGEEGVCYWFRYNQALFIMLNNEDMHSTDDLLKAQRWVKGVVNAQKESYDPPTYIIVCEHYQWFYGGHGSFSQYNRWHELFDELGVDLALAGNNHIYLRSSAIFDGKKTDGNSGTVYIQSSSSDNERGQGMGELTENTDLVEYRWTEGGRTVGAMDMQVDSKAINIRMFDRDGNLLDSVTIPAKAEKPVKEDIRGQYLRDSLDVMTARCRKSLQAAYMAEKKLGERKDIPGWEGFPVELWEYHTGVDIKLGVPKKALVYMLNPDAQKLAKWIINAVYDVTGEVKYEDLEKVRNFITWQSGAQFPVKGVVYEDMYTRGFYEPYVFKDGVTVYIKDDAMRADDKTCTEEQLQFYLEMDNSALRENTGRYARICSTTREMYYKAGGTDNVGWGDDGKRSQAWLDTVARLYKEAWNSDRNFLIYAWAYSNLRQE